MNIYIDNIIFYLQKSGGISVVWEELLKRFFHSNLDVRCLEYNKVPNNLNYTLIKDIIKRNYLKGNIISLLRYFPIKLPKSNNRFIFHSTYYRYCQNRNAINITTVHDFTYERYSKGIRRWIHCYQKYKAILKSDYVVCISENTKKDLIKYVPSFPEDRIRVIYNGVSDNFKKLDNWQRGFVPYERYSYLLFVGAREGYKNFRFLVEAIEGSCYNLVIAGASLSYQELELLNNCKCNYYYAGRVSEEELNYLYNGAYALIYPSSYEGFGIPVIEAQRACCPVIAFNSSSIPEIIGDRTTLLNELSSRELNIKLNILKDTNIRNTIIEKGLQNSLRFNWDMTYNKLIELYNEAYRNSKT